MRDAQDWLSAAGSWATVSHFQAYSQKCDHEYAFFQLICVKPRPKEKVFDEYCAC